MRMFSYLSQIVWPDSPVTREGTAASYGSLQVPSVAPTTHANLGVCTSFAAGLNKHREEFSTGMATFITFTRSSCKEPARHVHLSCNIARR